MTEIEQSTGSVAAIQQSLEAHRYICSDQIATAVYLAYHLHKPILTLDIPFPPTSVWFDAGEALELTIASHEVYRAPPYFKRAANVPGTHRIHFGGQYDSYLQVPIVPVS